MDRLADMQKAAHKSGLTIDVLQVLTQGLSRQAFLRVMGNASSMPSYMKSSESPYFVLRASAPSSDSLCVPASHKDSADRFMPILSA